MDGGDEPRETVSLRGSTSADDNGEAEWTAFHQNRATNADLADLARRGPRERGSPSLDEPTGTTLATGRRTDTLSAPALPLAAARSSRSAAHVSMGQPFA